MQTLILSLWGASIAARALASFRLHRNGVIDRLPVLWALLTVETAQASLLLFVLINRPSVYARAFALTSAAVMLFGVAAPISLFWALVEYYPRFRVAGTAFLGVIGLAAAAITWLAGYMTPLVGWAGIAHSAILAQRAVTAIMLLVLVGVRILLPRIHTIPIRRSTQRAADILAVHIALALAVSIINILGGPRLQYNAAASLVALGNGLVFGLLCAFSLAPSPDDLRVKERIAEPDDPYAFSRLCDFLRMIDWW